MATSSNQQIRISGIASYLPEKRLTNIDLEKIVDTSDEWITTRTGMKERRIAAENEYASTMGAKAAIKAIENAGLKPSDIDAIICATLTPDYVFPSTACLIQEEIGAQNAMAMDIQAACTGYLYGLSLAKAYVASGIYKNVVLVATERLSSILDYSDRTTCVLFGDGSTACVVSTDKREGFVLHDFVLGSDGQCGKILWMPGGGSRQPATEDSVRNKEHFLKMEGKQVFKHAIRRMESSAVEVLQKMNLSEDAITWMVPHQANIRIIQALAKRFDISMDKVFVTIHKYGNTSASSIGIALTELAETEKNNLKDGDLILLTAFGAGLTWGSAVIEYKHGS